jgi:hypothetical protein
VRRHDVLERSRGIDAIAHSRQKAHPEDRQRLVILLCVSHRGGKRAQRVAHPCRSSRGCLAFEQVHPREAQMLPVPKVFVPNGALFERSREFDVGHCRPGMLLRYRIIHLRSIS